MCSCTCQLSELNLSEMRGKKVLAVFAHPDDVDYYIGGTIAKLSLAGAEIVYLCATSGDKGDVSGTMEASELTLSRQAEQLAAADVFSVSSVKFLGLPDGALSYDRDLLESIVRTIRDVRPDIVIALDTDLFDPAWGVNHADHRAIATATIDAVYPYARNPHEFPDQPANEVETLLVLNYRDPNCFVKVKGKARKLKERALAAHASQWGDATEVIQKSRALGKRETFTLVTWH